MVVSLTMISVCSIRIICRELTYQLFLNGHPTFNDQQLNEINVTWGEKEFMTINVLFYVQACL